MNTLALCTVTCMPWVVGGVGSLNHLYLLLIIIGTSLPRFLYTNVSYWFNGICDLILSCYAVLYMHIHKNEHSIHMYTSTCQVYTHGTYNYNTYMTCFI